MTAPALSPLIYEPIVELGLREDLGRGPDLTTDAIVTAGQRTVASLVVRQQGTLAGLPAARAAFRRLDPEIDWVALASDGDEVTAGTVVARLDGSARAILGAERTALNLVGRLSGIATATRTMVRLAAPSGAAVVCTRKTTPGLRALEKYAVRVGGGRNHRFGLDDAVLVKDNHLALAGGIRAAVERVRARVGHLVKIEVEVDDLAQLNEALELRVDAVLLDNFPIDRLVRAVAMARGSGVVLEASGGIGPDTAAAIAATGVDLLSVGWLTHSAPALDVALDL